MSTDTKALRELLAKAEGPNAGNREESLFAAALRQSAPSLLDDLDAAQARIAVLEAAIQRAGNALAGADCCLCGTPVADGEHDHPVKTGLDVAGEYIDDALAGGTAALDAALAQARAEGHREGVERAAATVGRLTSHRGPLEDAIRALLPDSADDREARVQNVLRHIEDGTGDALWAERMKGTPHGPVAARWASRPVEERKALLADALSGEGITQGLPKGDSDGE